MSDMTIQWIVVGAVLAMCVWRIIGSLRRRRRAKGDGCCGCSPKECEGCEVARKCRQKPRR